MSLETNNIVCRCSRITVLLVDRLDARQIITFDEVSIETLAKE